MPRACEIPCSRVKRGSPFLTSRFRCGHFAAAHQRVEDDDMNVFCLGGKVIGSALARELIETFLAAHFSGAVRHRRRVAKVQALEHQTLENQEVGV